VNSRSLFEADRFLAAALEVVHDGGAGVADGPGPVRTSSPLARWLSGVRLMNRLGAPDVTPVRSGIPR
jgi:hypothetical protein